MIDADQILELKKSIDENNEYNMIMRAEIAQIKRYIFWGRIMSLIQLFFVVVPIILGIIYLPPLVKDYVRGFTGFNFDSQDSDANKENKESSLNSILDQYKDILNVYK